MNKQRQSRVTVTTSQWLAYFSHVVIPREYSKWKNGRFCRTRPVLRPIVSLLQIPFSRTKRCEARVWRRRIDISYSIPDAIRRSAIVLPEIRCSRVSTGSVVSQQTVSHTRNSTVFPHREQNFSRRCRVASRNEDPEEVTFVRTASIAASWINRDHSSSCIIQNVK